MLVYQMVKSAKIMGKWWFLPWLNHDLIQKHDDVHGFWSFSWCMRALVNITGWTRVVAIITIDGFMHKCWKWWDIPWENSNTSRCNMLWSINWNLTIKHREIMLQTSSSTVKNVCHIFHQKIYGRNIPLATHFGTGIFNFDDNQVEFFNLPSGKLT